MDDEAEDSRRFLEYRGPELIAAFEDSLIISKPMDLLVSPPPPMTTPESSVHGDDPKVRDEEEDNEKIQVGESELIMERVLGKRQHDPGPLGQTGPGSVDSYDYLCKWLGRGMSAHGCTRAHSEKGPENG
ncbi:uncharacterized protein LAJ45_03395 [Morchella importuna]|uniref:uncharacterized protein n=1 Tax=Morchella importuna TaxID=1174673 RepID=UPI001E8E6460|nr:uncharacterized protein LAJ45_03395 [Morchella importuna]KAH8152555.1 hypothetical protein LAJ45_03395 [Morchella importuna]